MDLLVEDVLKRLTVDDIVDLYSNGRDEGVRKVIEENLDLLARKVGCRGNYETFEDIIESTKACLRYESLNVCLRRAARNGQFMETKRLVDEGADDVKGAAIKAAKRGYAAVTMYLIYQGMDDLGDVFVASGFGGNVPLAESLLKLCDCGNVINQFFVGAVKSGNREMIELAVEHGAKPTNVAQYFINPDSHSFEYALELFPSVDYRVVFVGSASYSSLPGLMKVVSVAGNQISPLVLQDALVSSVAHGNTEVTDFLSDKVSWDEELFERLLVAAAHSNDSEVALYASEHVPKECLEYAAYVAAMRGNCDVLEILHESADPKLLCGYAGYSGSKIMVEKLRCADTFPVITAVGAIRGKHMDVFFHLMRTTKSSEDDLESYVFNAMHSTRFVADCVMSYVSGLGTNVDAVVRKIYAQMRNELPHLPKSRLMRL